jgi:hypothetical protein
MKMKIPARVEPYRWRSARPRIAVGLKTAKQNRVR